MYNINIVILCTWTVFVNSFSKGIDGFLFFYYNDYTGNRAGVTEYAARRKAQEGRKAMLYLTLDHELYLDGVSRVIYDNVWNSIKLNPRFDFNDFRVNFDMDVIKWVDEENANCIVDKVSVSAWVFGHALVEVDVDVYGHDNDYGDFNPDFTKAIDCNRPIDETMLYKMIMEVVKKSAGIAAFEVTQGITKEWCFEGF